MGSLKGLISTGSPLSPQSYDYVYREIKAELCLSSMSGGTDIVSCFVIGNPVLPVRRGEMQCKSLAMAIEVWDDQGQPLVGEKGELVCTRHFPAMPIGLWNDPDQKNCGLRISASSPAYGPRATTPSSAPMAAC